MLLNYHEMTMNEPRNSPARQKQFLVICTVMAAMFAHSCISSGLFLKLDIIANGVFPGGFYVYRSANRDYAAAMSLHKTIRQDLEYKSEYGVDDLVYHIYLDDPTTMGGRRQRWTSGILVGEDQTGTEQRNKLLAKNDAIHANPLTADDYDQMAATDLWPRLPYDEADLTAVDALVLNFPFTNGFVSSLVLAHRVSREMFHNYAGIHSFIHSVAHFFFVVTHNYNIIILTFTDHSQDASTGRRKGRRRECSRCHFNLQYPGIHVHSLCGTFNVVVVVVVRI